jgi:spore maturation protein SpmB
MQEIIQLMLDSGKTGIQLSLYILMPIMVIMMAFMNVLDKKNILNFIAKAFAPLLKVFGLPGLGVFAILQILFISFAAPIATLKIMDENESINDAGIAAAFAAVLVMAQANAAFPLVAVGLNFPVSVLTSLIGGLLASFIAFKLAGGHHARSHFVPSTKQATSSKKLIPLLFEGGEAGLAIVMKSIPPLIIAVFFVNIFKSTGLITVMETVFGPILMTIGIPAVAILPIVTKFMAGGTAMMAITLDLMQEGLMTAAQLNRVAGFTLNPLDPVGLALFVAAGPRVANVFKPAVLGAVIGILIRGVMHLLIF